MPQPERSGWPRAGDIDAKAVARACSTHSAGASGAISGTRDTRPAAGRFGLRRATNARARILVMNTPMGAGYDPFDYPLVGSALVNIIERMALRKLGGGERLDMTRLALKPSGQVIGIQSVSWFNPQA